MIPHEIINILAILRNFLFSVMVAILNEGWGCRQMNFMIIVWFTMKLNEINIHVEACVIKCSISGCIKFDVILIHFM